MKSKNKYMEIVLPVSICIVLFFVLLHGEMLLSLGGRLGTILRPFVFGGVMAYLLAPVCDWMEQFLFARVFGNREKKRKTAAGLSVALTLLLTFLLFYLFLAMLMPQLLQSLTMLVQALPGYANAAMNAVDRLLVNFPEFGDQLESYLSTLSIDSGALIETVILPHAEALMGGVSQTLGVLKDMMIGFFAALYVLLERRSFSRQASLLVRAMFRNDPDSGRAAEEAGEAPKEDRAERILRECAFFNGCMTGFIKGKIIDSLIIGILCGIGTVVLGMPYAALVSVIVGVTNVIPFFGPFLGAIPSALLILMVSPVKCVIFVVFVCVLQQFDGNVLGPKILGDVTKLSPFWILFSIILFGGLFGIPGMVIGVPVFGFAGHLLREWTEKRLKGSKNEITKA